ncbi:MAG: hypothetical protein AB7L09_22110 [Nitrospira sp.]
MSVTAFKRDRRVGARLVIKPLTAEAITSQGLERSEADPSVWKPKGTEVIGLCWGCGGRVKYGSGWQLKQWDFHSRLFCKECAEQ